MSMANLFCPYCAALLAFDERAHVRACGNCGTEIHLERSNGQVTVTARANEEELRKLPAPETAASLAASAGPADELSSLERSQPQDFRGSLWLSGRKGPEEELSQLIRFSKRALWTALAVVLLAVAVGLLVVFAALRMMKTSTATELSGTRQAATATAAAAAEQRLDKALADGSLKTLVEDISLKTASSAAEAQAHESIGKAMNSVESELRWIGEIADAGSRLRIGLRSGLDDLVKIETTSGNALARERAARLLNAIAKDYEDAALVSLKAHNMTNVVDLLRDLSEMPRDLDFNNRTNLVACIHKELDMGCVALAFLALREKTGNHFELFDVGAVDDWFKRQAEQKRETTAK